MMSNSDRLLAPAACELLRCEFSHLLTQHLDSGEVFQGTWNKTTVALKVLKVDGGVPPSAEVFPLSHRIHMQY